MIPGFRIGCTALLACLLLVSAACAQDVIVPSDATGPNASPGLPQFDNKPADTVPGVQSKEAPAARSKGKEPVSKYVDPTWPNLLQSMIRYNALDLNDEDILNEYIEVSDCDIFVHFYQNDFEWHKIKSDERDYLRKVQDSLPIFFHYDTTLQFGHYDFDKSIYFFTDKSKISNVNSFLLLKSSNNPCPKSYVTTKTIPQVFHAVTSEPIGLPGIPLKSDVASALFDLMAADKNTDRLVYARFNLHVTFIAPMEKRHEHAVSGRMMYFQMGKPASSVRFDATLDSIDFYEDADMTRLIYEYAPKRAEQIPSKLTVPGSPAK